MTNAWDVVHGRYGDPREFIAACSEILRAYPEIKDAHLAGRMGVPQCRIWEWFRGGEKGKAPSVRSMARIDEALHELIAETEQRREIHAKYDGGEGDARTPEAA